MGGGGRSRVRAGRAKCNDWLLRAAAAALSLLLRPPPPFQAAAAAAASHLTSAAAVHFAILFALFFSSVASTAPRWFSSFCRQSTPAARAGGGQDGCSVFGLPPPPVSARSPAQLGWLATTLPCQTHVSGPGRSRGMHVARAPTRPLGVELVQGVHCHQLRALPQLDGGVHAAAHHHRRLAQGPLEVPAAAGGQGGAGQGGGQARGGRRGRGSGSVPGDPVAPASAPHPPHSSWCRGSCPFPS